MYAIARSRRRRSGAHRSQHPSPVPLRRVALGFAIAVGLAGAANAQNAVTEWAGIVAPAINNAAAPRPPVSSEIVHTVIQLAVYDAVVAIEGEYAPYATEIAAPPGADVRAAVATAAYRTALGRVAASQYAYLDGAYAGYLLGIPDGQAKVDGIAVGEAAAAGTLALRANDGFNNTVLYQCLTTPPRYSEFEPNGGCGTQPVDVKVGQVEPFTLEGPDQFPLPGPNLFSSSKWVRDFKEVKELGRSNSSVRTPAQTDVVYFWSEHTYAFWNRNLNALAVDRGLGILESARLLAMAHVAASDAGIAGFHAKYAFRFARPRTAIPRAAEDGNRRTIPDATWTPLLQVNHPEYPSGHGFYSTALLEVVAGFFCTESLAWTLDVAKASVPQVVQDRRSYASVHQITRELDDARVWAGLHWRSSMKDGDKLGAKVAKHVLRTFEHECAD